MFRGSDFNYTAAITTKCPHFLQIVLENKLTRDPGCRKCKAALHPKISALKFKFYPINIGFAVDLTGHIRLIAIIPGPK